MRELASAQDHDKTDVTRGGASPALAEKRLAPVLAPPHHSLIQNIPLVNDKVGLTV